MPKIGLQLIKLYDEKKNMTKKVWPI